MTKSNLLMGSMIATLLLMLLFVGIGCSVEPEVPPVRGDSYGGGIVAYIFVDGDAGYVEGETHGLISATEDQSSGIIWATDDYDEESVPALGTRIISPLARNELGTGADNTDLIIDQHYLIQDSSSYAAGVARAYRGGDYTDWFLPSLDELKILYEYKEEIGGFDTNSSGIYWSSSEYNSNSSMTLLFSNEFDNDYPKNREFKVRAVRYF